MLRMNRMMMLSRGGGGGRRWWCGGWWCWGGGPMPRPRTTLCASLRSRNACEDFTRATSYRNLQEKCCSPDWAQNVDTHFVRACTVEMHFNVSQETSEEPLYTKIYRKNAAAPNWAQNADEHFVRACAIEMHFNISQETSGESLYTEIYRKNAAAQIEPRTRTHTLCEPEQSKCMSTCRKRHQKSHFTQKITGKMPRPQIEPRKRTNTLCEPAQSKCTSTFHKRHPESHFTQKFTGKMPRPRLSPERGHTLCASLSSRNACPHVARDIRRATLRKIFQQKCRGPDWAQKADEHFVRACAIEMHFNISQETSGESLYTEIYRKNAAAQGEHPDQAPAFTLTVKTPQCGHTVGEKTY